VRLSFLPHLLLCLPAVYALFLCTPKVPTRAQFTCLSLSKQIGGGAKEGLLELLIWIVLKLPGIPSMCYHVSRRLVSLMGLLRVDA
jgi:hypothetical protein